MALGELLHITPQTCGCHPVCSRGGVHNTIQIFSGWRFGEDGEVRR